MHSLLHPTSAPTQLLPASPQPRPTVLGAGAHHTAPKADPPRLVGPSGSLEPLPRTTIQTGTTPSPPDLTCPLDASHMETSRVYCGLSRPSLHPMTCLPACTTHPLICPPPSHDHLPGPASGAGLSSHSRRYGPPDSPLPCPVTT
ncbi:hypothetical protein BDZ85DRAFT_256088 [Elsinoe ampelina]|uniref:Uncharacterized protein n=1 Tax=Elsinoe ampelina TaxID=302913 RepID=A0A6A6GKU2_9PEZI|nr:hypothetical protein BDZ85DRAFT_256088 [Elsinoe ampelina]